MSGLSRRDLLKALALMPACTKAGEPPLFREVAAETGLEFHHFNGAAGRHYMPEIMGSGVALFDYDNDGALDIYLVQGTHLDTSGKVLFPPPAGMEAGQPAVQEPVFRNGRTAVRRCHRKGGSHDKQLFDGDRGWRL